MPSAPLPPGPATGPGAQIPGRAPAHQRCRRPRQRRRCPAGSPEAAAAAQLAVQELHGGVEDRAQAEAEARGPGSTRARRRREDDRGVGGAAPAQQRQGGPRGRARGRCHRAAVQDQAPARRGTGQGRLGGGGAISNGRPPPGPPRPRRAPRPHLHEHAAVGRDLERPRAAREGVLRVRQLQTEKGTAQPGPGRRGEWGRWRGERVT